MIIPKELIQLIHIPLNKKPIIKQFWRVAQIAIQTINSIEEITVQTLVAHNMSRTKEQTQDFRLKYLENSLDKSLLLSM